MPSCSGCQDRDAKGPFMVTREGQFCTDCHPRGRGRNLRTWEAFSQRYPEVGLAFLKAGFPIEFVKRFFYEVMSLGMQEASSIFGDPHDWDGPDEDLPICFSAGGYIGRRDHEIWLNYIINRPTMKASLIAAGLHKEEDDDAR